MNRGDYFRLPLSDQDTIYRDRIELNKKYNSYNMIPFIRDYTALYPDRFVKISFTDPELNRPNEVDWYEELEELKVTPKLFDYGHLSDEKYKNHAKEINIEKVFFISTEKWGISVFDKYIDRVEGLNKSDKDAYLGPGLFTSIYIRSPSMFDRSFPSAYIPEKIKKQIWNILMKLYDYGVEHFDIHTGNFVVKNGIVKIIDLDDCQRVEEKAVPNKTLKDVIEYSGTDLDLLIEMEEAGADDYDEAFLASLESLTGSNYEEIVDFFVKGGIESIDEALSILRDQGDDDIADYLISKTE